MQQYQLWNSVSNLYSEQGSIESQVLFGERIIQNNVVQYAYSQLLHCNTHWIPYPGRIHDTKLIRITNYFSPNAVVCAHTAVLEPLNISIPYGSPICIEKNGKLLLPNEMIHSIQHIANEIRIHPKFVRFLSNEFCRSSLCSNALQSLDYPYLWGGRCLYKTSSSIATAPAHLGVDCSGFVQILYQTFGRSIPRNARDQYKDCNLVSSYHQLPQGGLVFLQPDNKAINHVMLKIDEKILIHATESLNKVTLFQLGKDGDFHNNRYILPTHTGKVFFGVPKKRKAFF